MWNLLTARLQHELICKIRIYVTQYLIVINVYISVYIGARGSAVGRGTTLQAGRWWVAAPQPWGLTQPPTETNTRNPPSRAQKAVGA
jgi:hypothetical protein